MMVGMMFLCFQAAASETNETQSKLQLEVKGDLVPRRDQVFREGMNYFIWLPDTNNTFEATGAMAIGRGVANTNLSNPRFRCVVQFLAENLRGEVQGDVLPTVKIDLSEEKRESIQSGKSFDVIFFFLQNKNQYRGSGPADLYLAADDKEGKPISNRISLNLVFPDK